MCLAENWNSTALNAPIAVRGGICHNGYRSCHGDQSVETPLPQLRAGGASGSDVRFLGVPSVPESWAVLEFAYASNIVLFPEVRRGSRWMSACLIK